MAVREIEYKCVECGRHFNISTTKRAGILIVTCSFCHHEQKVQVLPPSPRSEKWVRKRN